MAVLDPMIGNDVVSPTRGIRGGRTICVAVAVWLTGILLSPADEIQPAQDAPLPLPPEQSQRHFQVPAGFRVELVASEPHLADPVAMAFDATREDPGL